MTKGIAAAAKRIYESGTTNPTAVWKKLKADGLDANRSYVANLIASWKQGTTVWKKKHPKKPVEGEPVSPSITEEMKVEFKPVTVPPELSGTIPTVEAAPGDRSIPAEAMLKAEAEGLITEEEMTGLIDTINQMSKNPRYQINEKTTPLLGKAWTRVINKRLQNVDDPNFDIYWAAAMTGLAAAPPLMNYMQDRRKTAPKPPVETRGEKAQKEAQFNLPIGEPQAA